MVGLECVVKVDYGGMLQLGREKETVSRKRMEGCYSEIVTSAGKRNSVALVGSKNLFPIV